MRKTGQKTPDGVPHLSITLPSVRGAFAFLGLLAKDDLASPSMISQCDFSGPKGFYRVFGVQKNDQAPAIGRLDQHVALTADVSSVQKFNGDDKAFPLTDLSRQSVQLLSELLALNCSDKSLPTPSIVPFVTR